MDDDMAYLRQVIQDIAKDYKLSPQVAQELLQKILEILHLYKENQDYDKGAKDK